MHCTEPRTEPRIEPRTASWWAGLALLAGCSAPAPAPAPAPASPPAASAGAALPTPPSAPAAAAPTGPAPAPVTATTSVKLPAPTTRRNWDEVRLQAAQRMVQASPAATYTGRPPEILLAIPVLEVELNADGSVRRIDVLRRPTQAADTVQLAIDAVRRGAPYGDVSRLPRPWKFVETFLFDDARRFKPRTLDL